MLPVMNGVNWIQAHILYANGGSPFPPLPQVSPFQWLGSNGTFLIVLGARSFMRFPSTLWSEGLLWGLF